MIRVKQRGALSLICLSVLLSGTAPLDPASGPAAFSVRYEQTQDWGTGYNARIVITNTSGAAFDGWVLAFDSEPAISLLWNGVWTQDDRRYTVAPEDWNRTIPAGGSVEIGFTGTYDGRFVPPAEGTLNGTPFGFDLSGVPSSPEVPDPVDPPGEDEPDDGPAPPSEGTIHHHFAPFVDAAAWPLPDLDGLAATSGVERYVLGFIVNAGDVAGSPCTPAWGGYPSYAATRAQGTPHLRDEIRAVRARGGTVMISFGGAAGTPVAAACPDAERLADAYRAVLDAYGIYELDFDVEGAWAAHPASIERRSRALALLQAERPALRVWLTLPVLPAGLTHDGVAVVRSALAAGVALAGVNVMTMDYGASAAPDPALLGRYAQDALVNVHRQVKALYAEQGRPRTDDAVWRMLGATPMIGVNDVQREVFTLAHAEELLAFAREKNLGLLSMWSINRDRPCASGPRPDAVFTDCSSIAQDAFAFAGIFRQFAPAAAPTSPVSPPAVAGIVRLENYPNPFNPSTTIRFSLEREGPVELSVYDLLGRPVARLFDGFAEAGRAYDVPFDGGHLTSGVYVYRLQTGTQSLTATMLLAK